MCFLERFFFYCVIEKEAGSGIVEGSYGVFFFLFCWFWKVKKVFSSCDFSFDCNIFCYFSFEFIVSRLLVWFRSNVIVKKD